MMKFTPCVFAVSAWRRLQKPFFFLTLQTFIVFQHVMEITSLHIAAVKQQNDYENALKLGDDLKVRVTFF